MLFLKAWKSISESELDHHAENARKLSEDLKH